jgi:acyl-CoA reductase-like NAD-dependent aldehyde dehydrogenase
MSRAYRIRVSESLRRVLRAEDRITTRLELLAVLPPEHMAPLLAAALQERGFTRRGEVLVRKEGDVTVTVNPATGEVTAKARREEAVDLEKEASGHAYDDFPTQARQVEQALRQELGRELQGEADRRQSALQAEMTERLEKVLGGLGQDLNAAVNRATAEALKIKAAQLGQVKQLTEDPHSGSLRIVIEV